MVSGPAIRFDSAGHLVVALTGTSVRLRSDDGTGTVALAPAQWFSG